MAAVRTDRFDVPSGTHDERVLAWTHALAVDTLAGRTVCRLRARAAQAFLDPYADAVDAFVVTLTEPRERRRRVEHVAALLPAVGLVDVKDAMAGGGESAPAQRSALAWSSVLGDVVEADRDDRVGGTLHVRPAVAPR